MTADTIEVRDYLCDFGVADNFYIDDVIIHDSRIGITYFQILANNTYHDADFDESGTIESSELRSYIQEWKVGSVSVTNALEAIRLWKQ